VAVKTLPQGLRALTYANQKALYSLLMSSATAALQGLGCVCLLEHAARNCTLQLFDGRIGRFGRVGRVIWRKTIGDVCVKCADALTEA